jgi:hypothetical protein
MLENLPESVLSQLADMDPVVGMLSKKLCNSCGVSCIDAWKFVTSRARYEMLYRWISQIPTGNYNNCDLLSVAFILGSAV